MKRSHGDHSYRDHRPLEDHEISFVIREFGLETLLELGHAKDRPDEYSDSSNCQCWCDWSAVNMMRSEDYTPA